MGKNKRRFTRIPFKNKVQIDIEKKSYTVDEIYNLSIGGCLLPLNSKFKLGTNCLIKIMLSQINDEIGVRVQGQVVRSESNMTAIKFITIGPDSLFHLQNIIRYNAPDTNAVEEEIDKHPGIF